jgi:anti-anti-sigma factor
MRKMLFPWRRDAGHALLRGRLARYPGQPLTWDSRSSGDLVVVVVNGELDAGTVPGLREQLEPLADRGSHLILDLAGLRFCDCAGLTLFLRMQQRARAAGGSLQLAAPTASVHRLIAVTRLSGILPIGPVRRM